MLQVIVALSSSFVLKPPLFVPDTVAPMQERIFALASRRPNCKPMEFVFQAMSFLRMKEKKVSELFLDLERKRI